MNCSIAHPLSFLGERWALLVLRDLFLGRRRFDEIQDSLGVATNVLSQRLATLIEEGIVERRRYSEHPERFEYRLTEKGRDLQPVLLALLAWGDRYTAGATGRRWRRSTTMRPRLPHGPDLLGVRRARSTPRNVHSRPGPGRPTSSAASARRAARPEPGDGSRADRRLRLPRPRARRAAARGGLGGARHEPRASEGLAAIEAAGIEPALADPERPGHDPRPGRRRRRRPLAARLGARASRSDSRRSTARGSSACSNSLVDTPVRGFVYEARRDGRPGRCSLRGGASWCGSPRGPGGSRSRVARRAAGPDGSRRWWQRLELISPTTRQSYIAKLG